jgi:GntP family gluconate:H+ symporter
VSTATGIDVMAAIASSTQAADQPWNAHDSRVLVVAGIGIAVVVLLIVLVKMHAFIALTIGSLLVGVASGVPLEKVTGSYETGVGGVLGYVGVLIALGAMLGKLLADSGGADRVVDTLLHGSAATLPWKMALIAAIVGLPMFFEIGVVILVPITAAGAGLAVAGVSTDESTDRPVRGSTGTTAAPTGTHTAQPTA